MAIIRPNNTRPRNFSHNSTCADSEPDWGTVDKAALPRTAYADQGEEGKKSTWSYPHHWVKDGGDKDEMGCYSSGTMYLHRGGLNAAWSAANGGRSGEQAPQAVKDHLQEHRRALGLEDSARTYSIKAKGEKEAEILLYEEIGEGWFGGVSAKQFAKDLRAVGDVEKISLRINSPGGDVFDGNTIYNLLKQHKARKVVSIDGIAASIASVIAMAGDEIHIADNAMIMIHPASAFCLGPSEEMRKMAEILEKIDSSIVGTYQKRTGLDEAKLRDLMTAETWMSSKEALDYGFVDDITDPLEVAAHFDLAKFKYKNAPAAVKTPAPQANRSRLARMSLAVQKFRIASNPK